MWIYFIPTLLIVSDIRCLLFKSPGNSGFIYILRTHLVSIFDIVLFVIIFATAIIGNFTHFFTPVNLGSEMLS